MRKWDIQFNPNYSRIILTLLKNLAFCFNKFHKKADFSNAGLPASIPQTIPHSKTSLRSFLNNAG